MAEEAKENERMLQLEQERWAIEQLELSCEESITRALQLTSTQGNHGTQFSFSFREPGSQSEKQIRFTRITGGDLPVIRFGFNRNDFRFDIILAKTINGITYEQYLYDDSHWRKVESTNGRPEDRPAHIFMKADLLQVIDEINEVDEVLSLAEDFSTELE